MLNADMKKRYEAFWNARSIDGGCCLYLTSPAENAVCVPRADTLAAQWENIALRRAREEAIIQNTRYHADAFPSVFVNFGPGCLAACVGGGYRWAADTVWFENEPVIEDWACPPAPAFRADAPMARLVEQYTSALLAGGAGGNYLVSLTDIGGTYDIIASLRGSQTLLTDLLDEPEAVLAYAEALAPVWRAYFLAAADRLMRAQGAVTSWMPIYSNAPYYPLQCDFCAMISPAMFRRFVLPDLEAQTRCMPRSIYHLDGPGEICHLDALLSLPRLNAIQWTSGAGRADVTDPQWFELYARIQRAGKGIVLLGANPDGVETLLSHVSPNGLYLNVHARDEKQAREIMRVCGR